MKKIILTFMLLIISISTFATEVGCQPGQINTANYYRAIEWYRTSAEVKALYKEIFLLGEAQIRAKQAALKLSPHQWGVVFDIDETLLNNSQHSVENALKCEPLHSTGATAYFAREISPATPSAKHITCTVKQMGGYVSLVSNRNGNETDPKTGRNLLKATIDNLNKEGICYDQVILANSSKGDKNSRFKAIITGNYPTDMVVNKKLPAHPVIAFFGDNIEDFPNTFQKHMSKKDGNSSAYDPFGVSFFVLPNPLYGSWQK